LDDRLHRFGGKGLMISILTAGFLVWVKIFLLGWVWLWIFPDRLVADQNRLKQWIFHAAGAGLLGILFTSLSTLILGEFGLFTVAGENITRGILLLCGIVMGWRSDAARWRHSLMQAMPVSLVLLIGFVAVMLYPHRGEWIIGGLDPGVYMNEAAALSRTGTFYPPDELFYTEFTEEQQASLIRSGFGRTERFPAILVFPEKKSFSFEFFRLTPSLFAAIHRSGDLHAMTRSNTLIALLVIVAFTALMLKHFTVSHAVFSAIILIAQPIFLYHGHIPITEMLQLLLLMSFLFLIVDQPIDKVTAGAAALLLAAATLNRFAFLPFAGILMICLALAEATEPNRRAVLNRRVLFILACMFAGFINYEIAPASLRGWSDIELILISASMAGLMAVSLDLLFCIPFVRRLASTLSPIKIDVLAGLAVAAWIATWIWHEKLGSTHDHDNLFRLVPFTGIAPLVISTAGALAFFFLRPRIKASILFPILIFLLAITWLLILRKSIMDLYPWATRRYLPYLVPFIALSCGYLLSRCWTTTRFKLAGRITAIVLFLMLLLELAPTSRRAWLYTQMNGISETLEQISELAGPDDILIADHADWGTPLALMHGIPTLNGREFWKDASGKRMNTVLPALARMADEGRKIKFLTSTDEGMNIYPVELDYTLDWTSEATTYQQIIQHKRANRYELTTRQTTFRLYTVTGFPTAP